MSYSQFLLRHGVSLVWINTRATMTLLRSLGRSIVSTPEAGSLVVLLLHMVDDREDQLPQERRYPIVG